MATLTSTGAVNLTSATNWSPSQIPATGDDLVIGAHTLTADADITANTITTTSTSTKITVVGTSRRLEATNGWFLVLNGLFNALSSVSLEIYGKLNITSGSGFFTTITSSAVKLSTIGEDQSQVLVQTTAASSLKLVLTSMNSASTLTTIGLFDCSVSSGDNAMFGTNPASMLGLWTHLSVGSNVFRGAFNLGRFNAAYAGSLYITGDFSYDRGDSVSNSFTLWRLSGSSKQATFVGSHVLENIVNDPAFIIIGVNTFTSNTVTISGKCVTKTFRGTAIDMASGTLLYRNQSHTIEADEQTIINLTSSASLDMSGLQLLVNGNFSITLSSSNVAVTSETTLFTCSPTGMGIAPIAVPALRDKIIKLSNAIPVLPPIETVAAGESYGYFGSEFTGTGLIVDPAIIAAASTASMTSVLIEYDIATTDDVLETIQTNPNDAAERSVDDDKPLTFSWPNSTDIITGEVSIDNGEYVPVLGSISYLRPEGNKYHYTLSYNAADRPTEEGIARYKFSSNNNTMYATLRITQTYTDEFATSVELMNSKLSSSTISIISPLSSDGTTLSIIQGDDYLTIDNRNILFTGDVTDQWVDLTDATVIIGVYGTSISKECVVISATGMQQISLELTSSDTNIPQGTYDYDVQATLSNGSIITLFRGKFTCSKSYTN